METINTSTPQTPIGTLLSQKLNERDLNWELGFLAGLKNTKLQVLQDTPVQGPDSWPYLLVATNESEGDSLDEILNWSIPAGVGLVINPNQSMPDMVISYGMCWNYRLRGEFLTQTLSGSKDSSTIINGEKLFTGAPSSSYWPEAPRSLFKQFLERQGIRSAKCLMISRDQENWDLGFSIESLKNPKTEEHQQLLEAFSWFFPQHYTLMLVSESVLNVPFVTV